MDILDEIYELYKLHNAYERIEDGNSNELICLNHLLYERKWNLKSFDEKQNIRQHLKMKLTKIAGSQEEYEERFELENAIISIHALIDIIESKINTLGGFDDSMTIRFRSMLFVEKYLINEYKNPKTIRTSNYNLLINLIKEILSNYNVEYKNDIIKLRDIIIKKNNLLNSNVDG